MYRLISILMTMTLGLLLPIQNSADADPVYFIYTGTQYRSFNAETGSYNEPMLTEIRWFPLDNPTMVTRVEVPHFYHYALSPSGTHLAFKETDRNGSFYILNLRDQSLTLLDYREPVQEFLNDDHTHRAGSLLWSPDGSKLAFTGSPDGERTTRADVLVYDVSTGRITTMTDSISIVRTLILPSSWSPDGAWLVVYGAWTETEQDGSIRPLFRSGALSADGQQFLELAPSFNTCRLHWSPDMRWLASETSCFAGTGNSSGLLLIPFNPEPVTYNDRRLDEVITPLRLDWYSSGAWNYSYHHPIWKDANTLIAHRRLTPVTFGYLPDEITDEFTARGWISFDVNTYSENAILPNLSDLPTARLGNWLAAMGENGITAFNPIIDRVLEFPDTIRTCPISYALQIEAQGDYAAVIDACEQPFLPAVIRIYETISYNEDLSITANEAEFIKPLGFFR